MGDLRVRAVRAASILGLAAVLAACGAPLAGTPRPAVAPAAATTGPSGPSGAGPTTSGDPTSGPVPSQEPLTDVGEADVARGRRLEARRLANQMPLISEVDPALAIMDFPTQQIDDDLSDLLLTQEAITLLQHTGGLELGFVASRTSTEGDAALMMMVMEFASAEQAAAAAGGLPVAPDKEVVVTAVPGATAGRLVGNDVVEVEVAVSSGVLLLYARAVTWKDGDGLPLAEKAVTLLAEAMSVFRVTPAADRVELPSDVDSLAAHTLPNGDRGSAPVHTAHAALHYQYEQVSAAQVFANAGVDVAALGDVSVYRTADGPRAKLLQAHFLSESAINGDQREIEIDGLPASVGCTADDSGSVTCAGTVKRYTFKFSRDDAQDAVPVALRQQNLLEQL